MHPGGQGRGGVLVGQYPVERRPVHLEQRGDPGHGLALGAECRAWVICCGVSFGLGPNCTPRCLAAERGCAR